MNNGIHLTPLELLKMMYIYLLAMPILVFCEKLFAGEKLCVKHIIFHRKLIGWPQFFHVFLNAWPRSRFYPNVLRCSQLSIQFFDSQKPTLHKN